MSKDTKWGGVFRVDYVRGNFVKVVEPDTEGKYARGKYCMTLLVPKNDKDNLNAYTEAIADTAGVEDISDVEKHPMLDDNGDLRDGDVGKHANWEGYPGHVFFTVTTKEKPDLYVIDENEEPVIIRDENMQKKEFYSGAYYSVLLQPYMYEPGKVTLYIKEAVCKLADGKKLAKTNSFDAKTSFMSGLSKSKKAVAALKESMGDSVPVKKAPPKEERVAASEDTEVKKPTPKKKNNNLSNLLNA